MWDSNFVFVCMLLFKLFDFVIKVRENFCALGIVQIWFHSCLLCLGCHLFFFQIDNKVKYLNGRI